MDGFMLSWDWFWCRFLGALLRSEGFWEFWGFMVMWVLGFVEYCP